MKKALLFQSLVAAAVLGVASTASAQTETVINAFDADAEGWQVRYVNGGLTNSAPTWDGVGGIDFSVTGDGTNLVAFADAFNNAGTAPFQPAGGISDFTGATSLEYDMSITTDQSPGTTQVFFQFENRSFSEAISVTVSDIPTDGTPQTVVVDVSGFPADLLDGVITYGMKILPAAGETQTVNVTEVRKVSDPDPTSRLLGIFDGTGTNGGTEGWVVNGAAGVVGGFAGGPGDSVGITIDTNLGVDGAAVWTLEDETGMESAFIGTYALHASASAGSDFRARPMDLSYYDTMRLVISCDTNDGATIQVQPAIQSGPGYENFNTFGEYDLTDSDGNAAFQTIDIDISEANDLQTVQFVALNWYNDGTDSIMPAMGTTATIALDSMEFLNTSGSSVESWEMMKY